MKNMDNPLFLLCFLYGIILVGSIIMLVYVKFIKSDKSMTLEESIQKLKNLSVRVKEQYNEIHESCLEAEENRLLYERWMNTRSEIIRQKLHDGIVKGNKKWEQLLCLFPSPDKPFDIDDVKDDALKSCIQEIERLEAEDHELFSYILKTFKSEEERIIIKDYLSVRFPRLGKKENKVNNKKNCKL